MEKYHHINKNNIYYNYKEFDEPEICAFNWN